MIELALSVVLVGSVTTCCKQSLSHRDWIWGWGDTTVGETSRLKSPTKIMDLSLDGVSFNSEDSSSSRTAGSAEGCR